jgi:predicted negative regulator of RcsB-dependent stress response
MSSEHERIQRELKAPDEFTVVGTSAIEWAQQHGRLLIQVGLGVLAVLVGVGLFLNSRVTRNREANFDLAQGLKELADGHYKEAATRLSDAAMRWDSTAAGNFAGLFAAQAQLRTNEPAAAIPGLQAASQRPEMPTYLKQQAVLGIAQAQARSGDLNGAAGRYAEAVGMPGPYTAVAVFGEAQVREKLGDAAAAKKLYERIVNEFSTSPDVEIARSKVGA